MSRRLTLLPLIWLGIGLVPQVSVAATDVVAPVTAVTVYSDRARVLRTARVALRGGTGTRVELPLLPAGVDASSIRVELDASRSPDAEVSRVEIGFVQPSEVKLPSHEAEKLLAELESLDDQLAQLAAEQSAYAAQLRLIGRLLPSANGLGQPTGTLQVPPPRLNPLGWGAVMGWTAQLYDRVQKKQHELSEKQRQIHLSRRVLVEKGQQLGGLVSGREENAGEVDAERRVRVPVVPLDQIAERSADDVARNRSRRCTAWKVLDLHDLSPC